MIQLIELIAIFVGMYVITRMLIYFATEDLKMNKFFELITKALALLTIVITIICVFLAVFSFIGSSIEMLKGLQ